MRVEFQEYNGFAPDPLKAMIAIRGAARPRFAYTYQIIVDEICAHVSRKVPEATGQNQHPLKKGETAGQLVLGRTR